MDGGGLLYVPELADLPEFEMLPDFLDLPNIAFDESYGSSGTLLVNLFCESKAYIFSIISKSSFGYFSSFRAFIFQ